MKRRDYLKAAGAIAAGSALAGCPENTSGRNEVDDESEYEDIGFPELELRIDDLDYVEIEGHLQYDGLVEWQPEDANLDPKQLRTYTLYEDDPEAVDDPENLTSIQVVEYDDLPIMERLPEAEIADRQVHEVELYGELEEQKPLSQTQHSDLDLQETYRKVIKAHGVKPNNTG